MKRAWIVGLLVAASAPSHAGVLRWTAPDACPEAALRASVALRVDTPVDSLPLDLDITIATADSRFTATLAVSGAIADSRTLTSASCRELTDALAIVIARLASMVPPPAPVEPAPAVEPPPTAIVAVGPVVVRAVDDDTPTWNGGVRLAGIVGIGGASDLGIAADLGVWATWRSFSLELSTSQWASNTTTLGSATMAGVDVDLAAYAVRAGWRPTAHRVHAWVVGELGTLEGTGVLLDDARRGSARWSAVGGGGALTWPVADHIALVGSAELEFLTDHVTFAAEGGTVLYRTSPVAFRSTFGVEIGWR